LYNVDVALGEAGAGRGRSLGSVARVDGGRWVGLPCVARMPLRGVFREKKKPPDVGGVWFLSVISCQFAAASLFNSARVFFIG
jgi:hypothetical protein